MLKILFFSFTPLLASGVETFRHPTCVVNIHKFNSTKSWDKALIKRLYSNLEAKGYFPKQLNNKKQLMPGDFHLQLKRTFSGKVYKECLMEVVLKQASSTRAKSGDSIVHKKESLRKFPRQTFQGHERCNLALDDLFFSMNICKSK